jgi:hypothetical protein
VKAGALCVRVLEAVVLVRAPVVVAAVVVLALVEEVELEEVGVGVFAIDTVLVASPQPLRASTSSGMASSDKAQMTARTLIASGYSSQAKRLLPKVCVGKPR